MEYKLDIKIMGIPERANSIKYILEKLGDEAKKHTKVYIDKGEHGVWWNAKRCYRDLDYNYTHLMLIQDDVLVSNNLYDVVKILISLLPNNPIGIYGNDQIMKKALLNGHHWVIIRGGAWGQCMILPIDMVKDFNKWCDTEIMEEYRYDDRRFTQFFIDRKIDSYFTVPSLIQHNTNIKTSEGHHNPSRSNYFIGEEKSGLNINWLAGLNKPYRTSLSIPSIQKYLYRNTKGGKFVK